MKKVKRHYAAPSIAVCHTAVERAVMAASGITATGDDFRFETQSGTSGGSENIFWQRSRSPLSGISADDDGSDPWAD